MRKAFSIYKRDGLLPILTLIKERVVSAIIRKRYGYPKGFLLGLDTVWLTGNYATIGKNLRIGKRCRVEVISEHNSMVYTPKLTIGNNVSMNDDVHIGCVSSVRIGNNVLMGSKIFISDHNHGNYSGKTQDSPEVLPGLRLLSYNAVHIEDNVWLGEMVSVLPGVTIGRGSIIGSNSVVSRSIPPYSIAVGSPAKVVKQFDEITQLWLHTKETQ